MDAQTLGVLLILALPIGGVALFAWGHAHGMKTMREAYEAFKKTV